MSLLQSKDQICISCSGLTESIADTTKSSVFQWLRSEPACFTGVQESEVHNGGAGQGSDVHQLLKLYKEEREQLSKDVLYYKQSCKDLKRRLKTEVMLGACQVHLCFETRMSLHDTRLAPWSAQWGKQKYAHREQGDCHGIGFRTEFSLCTCWWMVATVSDLQPVCLCFLLDPSFVSDAKLQASQSYHSYYHILLTLKPVSSFQDVLPAFGQTNCCD